MDDIINEAQNVLSNGGNIIKTRDDRELILVDKDGKIQNAAKCGWLPENEENINNSHFYQDSLSYRFEAILYAF